MHRTVSKIFSVYLLKLEYGRHGDELRNREENYKN